MLYSDIKLISFDLDDTLYNNEPVIQLAEKKSQQFLRETFYQNNVEFDYKKMLDIRRSLIQKNDQNLLDKKYFFDDVTQIRQQVLQHFCSPLNQPDVIAKRTFQIFYDFRQLVIIENFVEKMLSKLSESYMLVSISNGNCDAKKLSINQYFKKHYSPALALKAKPDPQMLEQVMIDFKLEPQQILHVGDSLRTDGKSAELAGCVFHHLSPFEQNKDPAKAFESFLANFTF